MLKTTPFSKTDTQIFSSSVKHLRRLGWLVSLVEWYGGGFKGFCGSRCKEQCTRWNSFASAGPEADLRSGSMTGPRQTCGPFAMSHSVCPPLGDPCCWTRARCSSEALQVDDRNINMTENINTTQNINMTDRHKGTNNQVY